MWSTLSAASLAQYSWTRTSLVYTPISAIRAALNVSCIFIFQALGKNYIICTAAVGFMELDDEAPHDAKESCEKYLSSECEAIDI